MFQSWKQVSFLHWSYEPAVVQRLLPAALEVETWEGRAWVGLIPFINENLRPPFTPVLPWLSRFAETNVRTYVRAPDGSRGVWFFSLDASRLAAVVAAMVVYRLPYRWARMRLWRDGNQIHYRTRRRWPGPAGARGDAVIEIGDPLPPDGIGDLDRFLTARFRLYARVGTKLAFAPVEHAPWPLAAARVIGLKQDLVAAAGLPAPQGDPVVHYSPGVDVRVGALRVLRC